MKIHPNRLAIAIGAVVVVASTALPWLVNAPAVVKGGPGTVYGITTVQGMVAAAAAILIVALMLRHRTERPGRLLGGGAILLAIVAVGIGSLVLGVDEIKAEIEADASAAGLGDAATDALNTAMTGFDMGTGGYVLMLGVAVVVVGGLVTLIRGARPGAR